MASGPGEGKGSIHRHFLQLDYAGGWKVEELREWLEVALRLGATGSSVVRSRSKGTLGPAGFAGLEITLPLPARDAGSSTDGPEEEGGGPDGERSGEA